MQMNQLRSLALIGFTLGVMTCSHVWAMTLSVVRNAELLSEPYLDARVLKTLQPGDSVEWVKSQAAWVQVKRGQELGWVRAYNLKGGQGATLSKVSQVESGRSGSHNVMSTTGVRSLAKASRHALIIGISNYSAPGITALKGVPRDMDSAKSISLELGIPEDNIVFLRDDQATAQGMREAIQQLDRRVQSGDRVFVYYSGHGVRWIDPDVDKNSCTEGLMASDGQAITNREMSELMAPITKKAEKLIVFYDACHSGGIANRPLQTRSIQKNGLQLTPKFVSQVSPELCATPSNLKTRSLSAELKKRGAQPVNVVSIAASRPDEVSFDDPRTGGLATASWRDCLKGAAKDLDSSGALSVDEITACAQQRIDEKLNQFPEILGQKMTIGGNQRFVPSYFAQAFDATAQSALQAAVQTVSQAKPNASIKETATAVLSAAGQAAANTATQAVMTAANQAVAAPAAAQPAISKAQSEAEKEKTNPIVVDSQKSEAPVIPASPAMTLAVAPTPAFEPIADMTPTLPTPTTQVMGPEQLLEQIHAQRDVSRVLKFKSLSQKLKIDQDALQLTIQSPKQGYLYLAMAGSDGKSLYLLFPNQLEQNNLIQAGVAKSLPSKNWRIVAGGPKGVDTLLAVVTDSPRDLSLLQGESAGPFVMPLMTKNGKSQLQQLLATSSNGSEAVCQSGSKTRNLKIVQACSDAYASSILRVEELP